MGNSAIEPERWKRLTAPARAKLLDALRPTAPRKKPPALALPASERRAPLRKK